jgi:hypothetical protein
MPSIRLFAALVLVWFLIQTTEISAQQIQERCGYQALLDWKKSQDPDFDRKKQAATQFFNEQSQQLRLATPAQQITIPVVVHIMHAPGEAIGTASNISDAQILSQLAVLNEDFRKTAGSRGFNTHPFGADTEISFCLAKRDPAGNPTNGINRVAYTHSANHNFSRDEEMKALSIWPTNRYMNIWVVKNMSGILGYAYLAEDMATDPQRNSIDGVVIACQYFGSRDKQLPGQNFNLAATYDLGRTTTHEVGHFLNLLHTWGDGDCTADDEVGDTPNCNGPYYGCDATAPVQCGQSRMIQNYMDYSDDRCMNIYTIGQKNRMQTTMTIYPFRANLANPANVLAAGCNDSGIVAIADTLYKISGDSQLVRVGQPLSQAWVVRVVNQLGGGYGGHPVRFQLTDKPAGETIELDTLVYTAPNGLASLSWYAASLPGPYRVQVSSQVQRAGNTSFFYQTIAESALFPNPTSGEIVVKLDLPDEEQLKIQLFNSQGQLVMEKLQTAQYSLPLNITAFPQGVYQLRIVSRWLTDYFKVIKYNP